MKTFQIDEYCNGCKSDIYNHNNIYGINKCFNVDSAKIVRGKLLPVDQENQKDYLRTAKYVRKPHCYHPARMSFVTSKTLRERFNL